MNAKTSVTVICVEGIIYLLLHNLHDCTFKNTKYPFPLYASDCLGTSVKKIYYKKGIVKRYSGSIKALTKLARKSFKY